MPKPVYGDNGSGMHCHQSIWKDGKPVFAGNKYADLSEPAVLHRRRHQARQGDQRLHQPVDQLLQASGSGLRSAVLLAYSAAPLGACRIPYTANPKAKRVEVRFPDPMANPYLGLRRC